MIELDIWDCREKHFIVWHSIWKCRLEERSNFQLCLASYAWIRAMWLSGKWCWRTNCTVNTMQICPLSHYAWWKVSLKVRLVFFLLCGRRCSCLLKCSESLCLQYTQRRHGDKCVIRVTCLTEYTVWHHVYYVYLTVTSSVQMPTAVKRVCRLP